MGKNEFPVTVTVRGNGNARSSACELMNEILTSYDFDELQVFVEPPQTETHVDEDQLETEESTLVPATTVAAPVLKPAVPLSAMSASSLRRYIMRIHAKHPCYHSCSHAIRWRRKQAALKAGTNGAQKTAATMSEVDAEAEAEINTIPDTETETKTNFDTARVVSTVVMKAVDENSSTECEVSTEYEMSVSVESSQCI